MRKSETQERPRGVRPSQRVGPGPALWLIGVAVYSFNWVTGQGQRYALNDDIFAPEAYKWRESSLEVTRPVYDAWVGAFLLMARSPLLARVSSGIASVAALFLFFLIGRRLHSPGLGVFCVLATLADPFWLVGSTMVRTELPLLAASALVFFLLLSCDGPWKEFAIGVVAGLQVGIHPNAIPVHIGIFVSYCLLKKPSSTMKSFIRFALGGLAGVLLVFCCLNIERLVIAESGILAPRTYPPIASWPWNPWGWLKNTVQNLVSGQSYYLSKDLVPGWPWAVKLYWSGTLVCLLYGPQLYRNVVSVSRALFALGTGVCVTFLGMMLLVSRQEALYALNFKPLLVPLVALTLYHAFENTDWLSRAIRILGSGLLMASLFVFVGSAITTPQRYKSYDILIAEIQTMLQPVSHSRVIGPMLFWYALPLHTYRDVGALEVSRYYTGGRADVTGWVSHWPPDIFVTDWSFRRIYMRNSTLPEQERLSQLLRRNLRYVGKIDAGYFYDFYSIYQVLPTKEQKESEHANAAAGK
jgi:hypothetical protein